MNRLYVLVITVIISGCTFVATTNFDTLYGAPQPQNRLISAAADTATDPGQVDYWKDVKPILDNRCVSCHACYDAPCQLKLTAIEGLDRGANKTKVYNPAKLKAGKLSRLFEDAQTTASWRAAGFHPVLNEHGNSAEANRQASVLYQMLELKARNPLPEGKLLAKSDFSLDIDRKQYCAKPNQIADFTAKHPLWGMPYALPGLADDEQQVLQKWVEQGARYTSRAPISAELNRQVAQWEVFLNGDSLKSQISSRYIYEHLYIAHIYFDAVSDHTFFKLVRSKTPPGEPVDIIATRRPYDDPGTDRVYYRLIPERETIVDKTHLPYVLNDKRKRLWQELFIDRDYVVAQLPSYNNRMAGNPFESFRQIPVQSRYKFLLEEAQYSIMNFIKGPVCRGQVALNVIQDHFWVFFLDPDSEIVANESSENFINMNASELALANTQSNIYLPLSVWSKHSKNERKLLAARRQFIVDNLVSADATNMDLFWDGNGDNDNAALTVFRHFDSATVEKGLLGNPPETAWFLTYSLMERIHYLLVAGYDVYGNAAHHLISRLQMDFLRIEGEANFLYFLPEPVRAKERANWYRGSGKSCMNYVDWASSDARIRSGIEFSTPNHKLELFERLQNRLQPVLPTRRSLSQLPNAELASILGRLLDFSGVHTQYLSELSLIQIVGETREQNRLLSLLRNSARNNVTSIFSERKTLLPEENTVTLVNGVVGSYPNTIFRVNSGDVERFVDSMLSMSSKADYEVLLDDFGVRRTSPNFWQVSDEIHELAYAEDVTEFGRLDYNRLENR